MKLISYPHYISVAWLASFYSSCIILKVISLSLSEVGFSYFSPAGYPFLLCSIYHILSTCIFDCLYCHLCAPWTQLSNRVPQCLFYSSYNCLCRAHCQPCSHSTIWWMDEWMSKKIIRLKLLDKNYYLVLLHILWSWNPRREFVLALFCWTLAYSTKGSSTLEINIVDFIWLSYKPTVLKQLSP